MNEEERFQRWILMWRCVGWRYLVGKSGCSLEDALDLIASLIWRVSLLEVKACLPFGIF